MKDLLIVFDMQEGFRRPASESIVPNVKRLVHGFKGEIIFSCFKNEHGSMFEKQLRWKKFQNKKDQSTITELHTGYRKFFHKGYTIFNKNLMDFVKKNKFKEIYLCGVYTDVCIIKAAMDAFDNNIRIKIVHDACNSLHGKNNHMAAVDSLGHIIGKNNVISTKDVIS